MVASRPAALRRPPGRPRGAQARLRATPWAIFAATARAVALFPQDGDTSVAAKKKATAKSAAKKTPSAPDEGYCVKCKAKRTIANAKQIMMANGRPALKGVCPVCGTGMFKILAPTK
mgnify:FL=1